MIESSWMEKLRGRKFRFPWMGRVKGIIIQQRSRMTKIKTRKRPRPSKPRRGVALPPRVSLMSQGEATKNPREIRASMTFWAVRLCTKHSVRLKGDR